MIGDINLIPQKEALEQKKTEAVKTSTIVLLVILLVVALVSAYYLVAINGIKKQIVGINSDVESLRGQITKLSQVEISARNLDKKYTVLKTLFAQRPKYSLLLEELKSRKPEELTIDSLDVKNGQTNVSGVADSYISIATFINNLVNKNFDRGNPNLKDLFTAVSLNSVSLEKATGQVKFFIVVSFDEAKLKQ